MNIPDYHGKQKTDLAYSDFHTDKAKDAAYMKQEQKAEEVVKEVKAQGLEIGGTEFFEHGKRRDILGENLTNYTPAKFALNYSASKRIDNPQRYYAKKGVGKQTFFADTIEKDSMRFLSEDADMTNHAVALDNYDFFLKHNDEIRTNLARTMLAKLDLDMDTKKTLNDILNGKEWKSASGEEVFNELKNRMRDRGQELNPKYMPIMKLLAKAEEIAGNYQLFKQERLKAQNRIFEEIENSKDPMNALQDVDHTAKERARTLIRELSSSLSKSDKSFVETLEDLRDQKEKNEEAAKANELLRLTEHDRAFSGMDAKEIIRQIKDYEQDLRTFRETHQNAIEAATKAVEKWAYKSDQYPLAMLASIADKQYFLKHSSEEEYKKTFAAMQKELFKIVPAGTNLKEFTQSYIRTVRENKEIYEHIYDPSKDIFNPQRQYMPLESVKVHDTAGNVLRDALYLTLMKHNDQALYEQFYTEEQERNILTVPTDPAVNEKKPSIDEVNDTYNAIMAIEKMTTGELSNKEAAILFDSPLFQESTVLNHQEVAGLKEFGQDLAEHAKVLKSKELVGAPSERELKESIQEMHYLGYARQLVSRLYPDEQEKNPVKRTGKFLNRNLFQNNKALYELSECMKSALNPTTSVETIPSLSKNCIEKLKDAYDKEAQELMQNTSMQQGWLATNFVGFLTNMMPVLAKARRDAVHRMVDEMNRKIAEDSIYTNNARNDYERMARMMNVQNDSGRLAHHLVDSAYASEFRDEIEKEGIVKAMMKPQEKVNAVSFESIYSVPLIRENAPEKERAETLKKELEVLRRDFASLRNELIDKAINDMHYKGIATEIKRIEIDNRFAQERLTAEGLLNQEEANALSKELNEGRARLETLREELYQRAMQENRFPQIQEAINKTFATTAPSMEELKRLEQQGSAKKRSYRDRIVNNMQTHRTEIDLSDLKGKEITTMMAVLAEMKQDIDKQILEGIKGDIRPAELERLRRDREKAVKALSSLQRQAILDKELFAESLAESLAKEYNVGVDKALISAEMGENGLSGTAINHIIERSGALPRNQRRLMRSNLYDINNAIRQLAAEKEEGRLFAGVDSKYSNGVSSMLGAIRYSSLFDDLKKGNDTYVAIDNIGDGKSHIKSAKGELGYYIEHIDKLEMMIETSKDEKEKNMYREALSDLIEQGEELHEESGINFGEYRDIAIKQAHSRNTLEDANSAVNQRSSELNRRL